MTSQTWLFMNHCKYRKQHYFCIKWNFKKVKWLQGMADDWHGNRDGTTMPAEAHIPDIDINLFTLMKGGEKLA